MAKDRRKLIHIHSSLPDKQPTPNTLEPGELAVNNAAGEEFISLKNSDNKVVRISTDKTMIDWMEKKTPIIYRGEVTNVDLTNNKSDIVLKYNQVVAGNTAKHDSVNGAKDEKGNFINPSEDGGVTDGAGVLLNMDLYAMNGGNPVFNSIKAMKGPNSFNGDFSVAPSSDDSHVYIIGHNVGITGVNQTTFNGDKIEIGAGEKTESYGKGMSANTGTYFLNVRNSGETHFNRAVTTINSADITISSGKYDLQSNLVNIGSTNGFVQMLTITGNVWTLKPSVFNLEASGEITLKSDYSAINITSPYKTTITTSSGDTTLSGKTVNIKSPDTTISGTNTDISSCGRISASTDNLTIEQCTTSGSATVKSNDITLSGSNINASATTKVDINSPYIDISGTTTDISGTTGRMRFGTFSVSGDNISASGKTKASIEAPTIEISGTNLNLSGNSISVNGGENGTATVNVPNLSCITKNDIHYSGNTKHEFYDTVSAKTTSYYRHEGETFTFLPSVDFNVYADAEIELSSRDTMNLHGDKEINLFASDGEIYAQSVDYMVFADNEVRMTGQTFNVSAGTNLNTVSPATTVSGKTLEVTEDVSVLTKSPDTTISGTNLTIKESDVKISGNTSISGTNFTVDETNTDISSCGRISASTDNLTIEQCTSGGSVSVKSDDITLSGSTININAGSRIVDGAWSGGSYSVSAETYTSSAGTSNIKSQNLSFSGGDATVKIQGRITGNIEGINLSGGGGEWYFYPKYGMSIDAVSNGGYGNVKIDAQYCIINGFKCITLWSPSRTMIDSYRTEIRGANLNITESESTINSTDTTISGTNLTIKESDVKISGNTSISGDSLNASATTVTLTAPTEEGVITVSSGKDYRLHTDSDICEEAGNDAKYYGENSTTFGVSCNGENITNNAIIKGSNVEISGDNVSVTANGKLTYVSDSVCFESKDNATVYGVSATTIGLSCDGNTNTKSVAIKGDAISVSGDTTNIDGNTKVTVSGPTTEIKADNVNIDAVASTTIASPTTTINGTDLNITETTSTINSTDTNLNGTNLTINESVVNITGDTSINGTINASGEATLGSDLNVSGSTFIKNNLDVTGNANATGNVTVGGTAVIEGKTIINDVLNVTGATNISGKTTIDNSLDVTDNANISGTATINGKATVNNAIDVSGAANIKGETVLGSNLTVNGNTSVGGNTTLGNDVTADTTTFNSKLVANGTATIAGEATINNNLTVTGSSSVGKELSVGGAATLGSTLNVTDAATLNSSLTVGGSATLNSTLSVANNTNIGNNLGVSGTSTLNGLATLNSGTAAHVKFTHGQFDADKEWNASGSSVYTVNIPSNSDEIKRTATSGNKSVAAPSVGYDAQTASTALTSTTIENAIRETRDKSVITVHASSTSDNDGILKSYKIVQDGVVRGTIDIPQDFLVKSGSVIVKDNRKYIDLVLNTKNTAGGKEQDSHIYIDVADLVTDTTYSSSNETVSATLSADNTTGLNKLDLNVLKTPGTLTVSTGTPATSKTFDGSSNTSVTVASDVSHLNRNQLYVSYASVTGQTSGVKFDPGAGTVNTTSTGRTSTITVPNEIGHLKNVRTLTISQEGTERGTYNPAGSANSSISITSSTLSSSPASDGGGNIGISGSWNPLSSANSTVYIPTNVKQMTNYIDDGEYSYYDFDAEVRASSFSGTSAVIGDAYVVGHLTAESLNVKDNIEVYGNINVFSAITADRITADRISASTSVRTNVVGANRIVPNTDSVSSVAIMTNLSVAGTVNATSFVYSSDIRLKRDIDVISDIALDEVEKVKFKQFGFKSDETNRITYGVIAQEVEEAGLDQLVHYNEDGYRAVDYTSLLILKNQLLENKINALTDQINTLMNKVEELEMKTNELVK